MARYTAVTCMIILAMVAFGPLFFDSDALQSVPMAAAERGNGPREITIPYTEVPISLDGHIKQGEWQTFRTGWYFDPFDGKAFGEVYGEDEDFIDQDDLSVTFYALYDDTYLYFGANVSDENIIVDSGSTFWRDDGVELMIDGKHDMDLDQRADDPWPGYEDGTTFLVTADNNWHYDYSNGTPYERAFGPAGEWMAVARMVPEDNYYIVEMAVRLDSISDPQPNSTIGFNVGVNDDDTGLDTKTALKWTGELNGSGGFPAFKNETMWGRATLRTYVDALLPDDIEIDEDVELTISGNLTRGNHPDLMSEANFTWTLPIYDDEGWNNITKYGPETTWMFEDPGAYHILLYVEDPGGIHDTTSTWITVRDVTPPVLSAEDVEAVEDEPVPIGLNVIENGWIDHVNWSFIDGDMEDIYYGDAVIFQVFEDPGLYRVMADVVDGAGNRANITINITILDNTPPVVIEIENKEALLGTSIVMDATGCYDENPLHPEPEWIDYFWTLRGIEMNGILVVNDTYTGKVLEVMLDIPGTYDCALTIEDGAGLRNSTWFNISILDIESPTPVLVLPDLEEMVANVSYGFGSVGSLDDDPLFPERGTFLWDFTHIDPYKSTSGNGSKGKWKASGSDVHFTFRYSGFWIVTLEAVDWSGNRNTTEVVIYVKDNVAPIATFYLPDVIDEDTYYFIDCRNTSDNNRVETISFEVMRGNGEGGVLLSGSLNVVSIAPSLYPDQEELYFLISDPGQYRIMLTARDNDGLRSSVERTITVRDITPPVPVFNLTSGTIGAGRTLYLSGFASFDNVDIVTFRWSVNGTDIVYEGGGDFVWEGLPAGDFVITLLLLDEAGNEGEAYFYLSVEEVVEEESPDEERSGIMVLIWALAVGLMILFLIVGIMYVRASRRGRIQAGGHFPGSALEE